MSGSQVSPEAIEHLHSALTEMYGLSGSPMQQYFAFWGRLSAEIWDRHSLVFHAGHGTDCHRAAVDFDVVAHLHPHLLGLGQLTGGGAQVVYPKNPLIGIVDVLSQAVRPIPYYIMSLVLLALLLTLFRFFHSAALIHLERTSNSASALSLP